MNKGTITLGVMEHTSPVNRDLTVRTKATDVALVLFSTSNNTLVGGEVVVDRSGSAGRDAAIKVATPDCGHPS